MDTKVLSKITCGLFVITAREGEKDNGCITDTVLQVAGNPLRIIVSVNKHNYTNGMIHRTGMFNASILSESARFETIKHFGFQSGRDVDKSVGITFSRSENGLMYVSEGVNSVISAKVESEIDLGSHTMFIAEVTDAFSISDDPSISYALYQKAIKPAPGANSR